MDKISNLYYEAHVTIEPVFDEKLQKATCLSKEYGFKVACLLMQKRPDDNPERSKYDTFITGHGKEYNNLKNRMVNLIKALQSNSIKVWRYKIEDTITDSRAYDEYGLLDLENNFGS